MDDEPFGLNWFRPRERTFFAMDIGLLYTSQTISWLIAAGRTKGDLAWMGLAGASSRPWA